MPHKYRIEKWINVATTEPAYTVRRQVSPRRWVDCTDTGKAKFFKREGNAKRFMDKIIAQESRAPDKRSDDDGNR